MFSGRIISFCLTHLLFFLRLILFGRIFSARELGIYSLVVSCLGLFTALADWGFFQKALYSPDDDTDDQLFSKALVVSSCLGVLALLLGVFFFNTPIGRAEPSILLPVAAIFLLPSHVIRALVERRQNWMAIVLLRVPPDTLALAATIIIESRAHLGIASIMIGIAVGAAAHGGFALLSVKRVPHFSFTAFQYRLHDAIHYGAPFVLYRLGRLLMQRLDGAFVWMFAGVAECGSYAVLWSISDLIPTAVLTLEEGLVLTSAREGADPRKDPALVRFRLVLLLAIFASAWLAVFSKEALWILLGARWEVYSNILQLFVIGSMIRVSFLSGLLGGQITAERPNSLGGYALFTSLSLILLGSFLIRMLGSLGGALFWLVHAVAAVAIFSPSEIRERIEIFNGREVMQWCVLSFGAACGTRVFFSPYGEQTVALASIVSFLMFGGIILARENLRLVLGKRPSG